MSAIAGFWNKSGLSSLDRCRRMIEAQASAGSDPKLVGDDGFAMARCLTRFLPEDKWDAGPATCGGGRLVADVRLDNREDLAAALNLHSPGLNQLSDSDLLLKCLLTWGEGALDKLVGSFAFAYRDGRSGTILLARDYIGSRPLHYAKGPGFFAFASMPRGLHALEEVTRAPSEDAARRALMGEAQPPSETFFRGISQIAPGHLLHVRNERCEHRRWWNFDVDGSASRDAPSRRDCAEQARFLLDQAVVAQLRGAGGLVGSHLSAGLDSAGVSATAARVLQRTGGRLLAFTAVPQRTCLEPSGRSILDEGSLAALVACRYPNVERVEVENGGSLADVFERNVKLWERPVPNPINDLWWSRISEVAANRKARIVLTGAMGNLGLSHSGREIFSELLTSRQFLRLAKAIFAARKGQGASAASVARTVFAPIRRMRQSSSPFLSKHVSCENVGLVCGSHSRDALQKRLAVLGSTDPGVFLAGAASAWGVDLRDPTADKRLMEFTLRLPAESFFDRGTYRALARQALADRLPNEVLTERRRGLQSADWLLVLRENVDALVAEAEALAASPAAAVVDATKVLSAVHAISSQQDTSPRSRHFHHALICALGVGNFMRS